MKKYYLTNKEEDEFNYVVENMKDVINLALYKCNIKNYADFYSYALEGLLVSFLMLKKGVIKEEDFKKFSFTVMKRKIIDEIRRRNKENVMLFENYEDILLFKKEDEKILEIEFKNSILKKLTKEEEKFLTYILEGLSIYEIMRKMKISRSKAFSLQAKIRKKSEKLLYNC